MGETKQIKATYTGSDKLSWSVEDTSIATLEVAEDALSATVKAIKAGSTNLSVKEANGSLSASLKITNSINAEPVSDLKVTATDATSVTISWTAPTNYENFTVKAFSVSTSQEGEESESEISLENGTTSETSFTISKLSSNSKYKFYVYTNYGGVQSSPQSVEATTSSISIELALEGSDFDSPTEANATITLIATVKDSSGNPSDLSITQWTSGNEEIATVTADETNANKATVTALGPSGTVNITATIKDGETELASKSYECKIVGKALAVSNVTVKSQSKDDTELSDKQIKVSWDAPKYYDSFKVELYKCNSSTINPVITSPADVTYPGDSDDALTDTSIILTVPDYGYYFVKVYSIYGEDVSSAADSTYPETVEDYLPCGEISNVTLDLSKPSGPQISFTMPSDSDLYSIKYYLDDSSEGQEASLDPFYSGSSRIAYCPGLDTTNVSKIKITTIDTSNNESSGKTFTIYKSPSLAITIDDVKAGYTGQIVISNISFSNTDEVTWTATSSGSVSISSSTTKDISDITTIVDAENSKIYLNGLSDYIGHAVYPSINFSATTTDKDWTVVNSAVKVTYNGGVKYPCIPTMTVWKLKSWWPTDLPPAIVPHISDSVTAGNIVMANFAGATQTSDMMYADATYTAFIVHPGLTNTDGTSISLEATNSKGESSGLYVYADIKGDVSWQSSYSNKTDWNYKYSSKPQLYTVSKDSMTDTQKSEAVFYKVSSTSSFASSSENAVPAGYEGWFNIKSAVNNAYWYGSCFNVSLNSEIATNGDSDVAILSQTWSGFESSDNPTEITDFTPTVSEHSITLTWTDPSDVDFAYLEISSEGKLLDGTTSIETQTITAGTQTATFEKLSAATSYTFTVTEYDAFANTTQVSTSATTTEDKSAPSDVSDLTANSGRDNVKLSWTNPSDVDAKTISIYQGDSTTAVETISIDNVSSSAENQSSVNIKNLTAGTEYTFTVKAVDYAGNESKGVTVKATPTTPSASNVEVEAKYTGSILVTWTDTTASETDSSGEAITYSYKVECTSDSSVESKTVETGVQKALFTGLTVGTEYTFKVTVVDSNNEECGSVTTQATAAKTVIWKIKNQFDSSYFSHAVTSDSSYITRVSNNTSEPYQYWIVRPALDETADVSFEATDINGTPTGLFWYFDGSGTRTSAKEGTGSTKRGFVSYLNYSDGSPVSIQNGTKTVQDLKWGSFYLVESTSTASVFSGFSKFHWLKVVDGSTTYCVDNDWYVDSLVTFSSQTGNQYNWAYKVAATTDVDYTVDSPAAPTNLAVAEENISLTSFVTTWTDPSDADLSYVKIAYTNTSDSTDAGSVNIVAGTQTATITGLTMANTYSVTATAYDVYGNASDTTSAISVTTKELTNVPQNVKATARFTGEILVTWDRAQDDTESNWYYKVVPADTNLAEYASTNELSSYAGTYATAADGVAQFKDLTSGTEYTFTVFASSDGTTWNSDTTYNTTTVSATATTVTKYLVNKGAYDKDGKDNSVFRRNYAGTQFLFQGTDISEFTIYPALDESITILHTVSTSASSITKNYDTFSLYSSKGSSNGWVCFSRMNTSVTETTSLGKTGDDVIVSEVSSDKANYSTLFMGYNSTDSCYTLRVNKENLVLGYIGSDNNDTEVIYLNDATVATCESTNYAWYFN